MTHASPVQRRDFFNALAPEWSDRKPDIEKLENALGRISFASASRIADIGCGTGVLLPELNSRAPRGCAIYCIDFAISMIMKARKSGRLYLNNHFLAADGEKIPIRAGFFDKIICMSTFAHFADKSAALAEFSRVLAHGGDVYIIHLLGSQEIAAVHRQAGSPIDKDILPLPEELGQMLSLNGFTGRDIIDEPGLYFAAASKRQSC